MRVRFHRISSVSGICGDILHTEKLTTDVQTGDKLPTGWTLCYIDQLDVDHHNTICRDLIVNAFYGEFKSYTDIVNAGGIFNCWYGVSAANRGPAYIRSVIRGACFERSDTQYQHTKRIQGSSWQRRGNITFSVCIKFPGMNLVSGRGRLTLVTLALGRGTATNYDY